MTRTSDPKRLFRLLGSPAGVERDVDTELGFHLEARAEALIAAGAVPEAARAQALREFGDLGAARAELSAIDRHRLSRDRLREWWDSLGLDVRFALRAFARHPSFVVVALATLALGIGGNVAIFSVVNAVLLRPLPYRQPDRLVRVWPNGSVPPGIFAIVSKRTRDVRPIAGYLLQSQVSLTGLREPVRASAVGVTAEIFNVLGSRAQLGRALAAGDDEPGRDRVVVLSHALWRSQFGGDPGVVGRPVVVDGVGRTVVGVMPPDFLFPSPSVQLWVPVAIDPRIGASYWWGNWLQLVGRLAPGVDRVAAQAEVRSVLDGARSAFPMRMPDDWGRDADVIPLRDWIVGGSRTTLLLLLGAVGLVLLVACVNVANLSLARAAAREQEIGIRAALGAGRGRVVRQLLTESVVLAGAGAAVGLLLAVALLTLLVAFLPSDTPRLAEVGIDGRVLSATVGLALLTALIFGLAPALRAARLDVRAGVGSGTRLSGGTFVRRRLADMLVVAQLGLAVILVAGASLLIESFIRLRRVDLGFQTENVTAANVPVPSFESDSLRRGQAFYTAVLDRVQAIPGVSAAAAVGVLPFGDGIGAGPIDVEDSPTPSGAAFPLVEMTSITPDYFRVMGIPLVAGRGITEADRDSAGGVVVVDEVAARKMWPGESPLGKRIRYVWRKDWLTVVGVVGAIRRDSLNDARRPSVYLPMLESMRVEHRIVARSSVGAQALAPALREAVASVDRNVPIGSIRSLETLVEGSAAHRRFATVLVGIFAAVALLLGAVGTYGVVAHAVTRRRREIGVRLALGARSADVLRMVLGDGLRLALGGALLGVIGAAALTRLAGSLLYGVSPTDPPIFAGVTALMLLVALAATLIPARRASRVDPTVAMRSE